MQNIYEHTYTCKPVRKKPRAALSAAFMSLSAQSSSQSSGGIPEASCNLLTQHSPFTQTYGSWAERRSCLGRRFRLVLDFLFSGQRGRRLIIKNIHNSWPKNSPFEGSLEKLCIKTDIRTSYQPATKDDQNIFIYSRLKNLARLNLFLFVFISNNRPFETDELQQLLQPFLRTSTERLLFVTADWLFFKSSTTSKEHLRAY